MTARATILAAMLATAGLAACGGDNGSNPTEPTPTPPPPPPFMDGKIVGSVRVEGLTEWNARTDPHVARLVESVHVTRRLISETSLDTVALDSTASFVFDSLPEGTHEVCVADPTETFIIERGPCTRASIVASIWVKGADYSIAFAARYLRPDSMIMQTIEGAPLVANKAAVICTYRASIPELEIACDIGDSIPAADVRPGMTVGSLAPPVVIVKPTKLVLVPFRITEDDVWWERLGAWVDSAVWEDEDNEVLRLTYEAFPFAELEVERRPMQLLAREYLDSVAGGPIWGPLHQYVGPATRRMAVQEDPGYSRTAYDGELWVGLMGPYGGASYDARVSVAGGFRFCAGSDNCWAVPGGIGGTIAHEIGHSLGLPHAPCINPNPDDCLTDERGVHDWSFATSADWEGYQTGAIRETGWTWDSRTIINYTTATSTVLNPDGNVFRPGQTGYYDTMSYSSSGVSWAWISRSFFCIALAYAAADPADPNLCESTRGKVLTRRAHVHAHGGEERFVR